jgi:putative DNA primase/helicase
VRAHDPIPQDLRHTNGNAVDTVDAVDTVSMKLPVAPMFPVDAMPEGCQKLVREAAKALGCPPEFVAVPMLAALASAIGNSRVIKLKEGWEEGAVIYAAVIADPGEKKTPAMKIALEPAKKEQARLRECYLKQADERKAEMRQWEVDKKVNARNDLPAPPPPEEPIMERTLVEDTTVEALAVVLEGTPRGVLVMRDELAGWVRSMDQYKSGGKGADRQFWLSGWSNSHVIVDRKGREEPLFLPRPFVSVVGAIQPRVLPELGAGREDGMMDRFLFAYPLPVPSAWSDHEISPASRGEYADLYKRLRELHMNTDDHGYPDPVRIHFSPCAKDLLKGAVNELGAERHRPGFPSRLKGPYSKLEAYLARLSLILAVARAADTGVAERVEEDDVLAAVVLVDCFKGMARRVYRENPRERFAEDVAKFLEGRGGYFKDEPHVLHGQLDSRYKQPRPDELTKKLKDIIPSTPGLTLNTGHFPKEGQSRRFVEISLENGVNGVNGVNPEKGAKLDMPGEERFSLDDQEITR